MADRLRGKYRTLPPDTRVAPNYAFYQFGRRDYPYPRAFRRITKRRAGRRGWREYNRRMRIAARYGFRLA